jgi:pSer/pThr/pTyr-binding forkhead associated (FHA) protein
VLERGATDPAATTTAIPAVVLMPGDGGEQTVLDTSDLLQGVPEGGAALVVTRGPNEGSRSVLTPEASVVVTIGRHPDSDIFLDDITVSRRHAEVRYRDGVFRVHDVGSLNGTYLNRRNIDDAVLDSGDELQVGKFRLLFVAHPPASGAGAD